MWDIYWTCLLSTAASHGFRQISGELIHCFDFLYNHQQNDTSPCFLKMLGFLDSGCDSVQVLLVDSVKNFIGYIKFKLNKLLGFLCWWEWNSITSVLCSIELLSADNKFKDILINNGSNIDSCGWVDCLIFLFTFPLNCNKGLSCYCLTKWFLIPSSFSLL